MDLPSRTVDIFDPSHSDKSFVKLRGRKVEISEGELQEDEEGWLAFQQKPKSEIEDIFKTKPPNIGNDLKPSQKNKLFELLEKHKKLFGKKSGLTNLLSHKIENSQVIFSKPRHLSPSENDQANKGWR